jgi:beta-glucanase (GH16 family)
MRPRRTHVLLCTGALVTASVLLTTTATAATARYRIGSGVTVSKNSAKKTSPSPSPTTSSPAPAPSSSTSSPDPVSTSPAPTPATSSATSSASTSPTPTPATSSAGTSTDPGCGGTVLVKADGTPWVCTFDDEFDGTSLNRNNWLVQTAPPTADGTSAACFVDDPNNVSVSDGVLALTVRRESAPFTCKTQNTSYTAQVTTGSVMSYTRFSQAYGRFEVRAKLPATTIQGLQETLWLWPDKATTYGAWPLSGEIDFGEFYSPYAGWNIPFIHYNYLQSTVSWLTNTNVYTALPAPNNQPGMSCTYDTSAFNTYTVIWQPGNITLQVDGKNCIVDNYSAVGLTGAAPFDQPFFMALTQGLGVGNNAYIDGVTPLPATTQVDYVRVWE